MCIMGLIVKARGGLESGPDIAKFKDKYRNRPLAGKAFELDDLLRLTIGAGRGAGTYASALWLRV